MRNPRNSTAAKTVLNFSVATSRFRGEGETREQFTEWHRIAAWGKLAAKIGSVAKGAHVKVSGELRSREYTNDSGKVQTYEILASKIESIAKEATTQEGPPPFFALLFPNRMARYPATDDPAVAHTHHSGSIV
jgi:single-strand DNA-binding protein